MMRKEFIKWQIDNMGISINRLKDMTGIGYATLNDFFNKENYKITADNYNKLVDSLFTPFEKMVYEGAKNKSSYYQNTRGTDIEIYQELIKRTVKENMKSNSLKISRSGSPISDDKGVMRMLPAHTKLMFSLHGVKCEIRIFNNDVYEKINKNDFHKENVIKEYFLLDL